MTVETALPGSDTGELVVIGAIERSFGVRGEMCVRPLSDVPGRFHAQLPVVLVGARGGRLAAVVTTVRPHGNRLIVGTDAIASPEAVAPFRGGYLYAARTQVAAPSGQFFQCDLLGLSVKDERGQVLGVIDHILETPAHDVFVVRQGAEERLVPAVKEWVRKVDLERRVMTVRVPETLEAVDPEAGEVRHAV